MAANDTVEPTAQQTAEQDAKTRRQIAMSLVLWGAIVVGVLGVAIIAVPAIRGDFDQFERSTQLVLTSILPLVGTWIGTVLAFYFAKDNFESASRVTKEIMGEEKLRSIQVTDAMIPLGKIDAFKLGEKVTIPAHGAAPARDVAVPASADAILINDALDFLAAMKRNRLPVFDASGAGKYVIHVSSLDRFRSTQLRQPPATPPVDPNKWTLGDFRTKDPDTFAGVLAWASVGESATLADAKQAMETTPNCIDVLVTRSGTGNSPVLGWLTNIEIGQRSKA